VCSHIAIGKVKSTTAMRFCIVIRILLEVTPDILLAPLLNTDIYLRLQPTRCLANSFSVEMYGLNMASRMQSEGDGSVTGKYHQS
jgi:hypothetical protein